MSTVLIYNNATPFVPPTSGLYALWDAQNSASVIMSGSEVLSWSDLSGNGRTLGTNVTGSRPTYSGSGASARMRLSGALGVYMKTAPGAPLSQPVTVYAVFNNKINTASTTIYDGQVGSTMALNNAGSGNLTMVAGLSMPAASGVVAALQVITTVWNGASSTGSYNDGTKQTGNPGGGSPNGFTLGAAGNNGSNSNIDVCEVRIYAGAHSASLQTSMVAYLKSRWAV